MKFQSFLGETSVVAKVFDGSHVELREDCHRTWRAKLDRARVLRGSLLKLSHCGGGGGGAGKLMCRNRSRSCRQSSRWKLFLKGGCTKP